MTSTPGAQHLFASYQTFLSDRPTERPAHPYALLDAWLEARGITTSTYSERDWTGFFSRVGVIDPDEQFGCMVRVAEHSRIVARAPGRRSA